MFGTIRRHQSWLWFIVGGITIISFVILGPNSCNEIKLNAIKSGGAHGTIGGHAITQDELQKAKREVVLRYFLSNQRWPDDKTSDFNVTREAYIRLFLIEKEKQYGVQSGPDTLAELARRILGQAKLDDFVNQVLKPAGLDEDDFERFLQHESGAQQLVAVGGLSGKLVTPGEAEALYRQEHQELACSMILLTPSNYLSSVTVSNDMLMQFYSNRMSVYREPARIQVNYVKFNVTNYWAATLKTLTNLNERVDYEVKMVGTNLVGHAKTPEESRAVIKDHLIRTNALMLARKDAMDFADQVYKKEPQKPGNLEMLAKEKGFTVQVTEPFDEVAGPKDLDVYYNFSKTAFQLTETEPFAGAVVANDGVYVLGFNKLIPASVPPFKDVAAKVTEDYRYFQAAMTAQQVGLNAYYSLTNGLAQGKTFTALAAQLGLKTESLPPFSLSTPTLSEAIEARVSMNALRQAAFSTEVGGVSQLARGQQGVFLLYVDKKLPPDETKLKSEMPGFLSYMRQARQADAFNQWFSVQIRQDPAFNALIQQITQETQMRSNPQRPK